MLAAWLLVISGWNFAPGRSAGGGNGLVLTQQSGLESAKIVPFVPIPHDVVERMLKLAQVKKGDVWDHSVYLWRVDHNTGNADYR